jgi:hypothetical protein
MLCTPRASDKLLFAIAANSDEGVLLSLTNFLLIFSPSWVKIQRKNQYMFIISVYSNFAPAVVELCTNVFCGIVSINQHDFIRLSLLIHHCLRSSTCPPIRSFGRIMQHTS